MSWPLFPDLPHLTAPFLTPRSRSVVFTPKILIIACYPDYNTHYIGKPDRRIILKTKLQCSWRFYRVYPAWLSREFTLLELLMEIEWNVIEQNYCNIILHNHKNAILLSLTFLVGKYIKYSAKLLHFIHFFYSNIRKNGYIMTFTSRIQRYGRG